MLREMAAIAALNLRSLPKRLGSSLVTVVGVTVSVGVLISVMAIADGMERSAVATGRTDSVVVLRGGATSELNSSITIEQLAILGNAPGLRHAKDNQPLLYPQLSLTVTLPGTGSGANVMLRGVGEHFFDLKEEVSVENGRRFSESVREVIVGKRIAALHPELAVGKTIRVQGVNWLIVGRFASAGDWLESEILTSQQALRQVLRGGEIQSVVMGFGSSDAAEEAVKWVQAQPNLPLVAIKEQSYYQRASQRLTDVIFLVAYVIGGIMGVGALFSVVNCLYSSMQTRRAEFGTLRAIGFSGEAVLASVFLESLLLTLVGGILGCGLAWLLFNGRAIASVGSMETFSQLSFSLHVGLRTLMLGVLWAGGLGLLGAIAPGAASARMPVVDALKRS